MLYRNVAGLEYRENKWAYRIRFQQVRVLARAEGWAMVRVPKAATVAIKESDLMPQDFQPDKTQTI